MGSNRNCGRCGLPGLNGGVCPVFQKPMEWDEPGCPIFQQEVDTCELCSPLSRPGPQYSIPQETVITVYVADVARKYLPASVVKNLCRVLLKMTRHQFQNISNGSFNKGIKL